MVSTNLLACCCLLLEAYKGKLFDLHKLLLSNFRRRFGIQRNRRGRETFSIQLTSNLFMANICHSHQE